MRYISHYKNLVLISKEQNVVPPINDPNPVGVYRFYNGELVVGDPTTKTGTGNAIDGSLLMVLFPNGADDLEKAGLNQIFFEAPPVDPTTVTAAGRYRVLVGDVVYNGKVYRKNEVIAVSGTPVWTGSDPDSKVALDISNFPVIGVEPYEYFSPDILAAWYKTVNLIYGDESEWRSDTWSTGQPNNRNPWTWVR